MAKPEKIKPDASIQVKAAFVLPDQVEEEAKIDKIEFYRLTYLGLALFLSLILLSGFLLLIIWKWKDTLAVKIACVKCAPQNAEYLLVHGVDGVVTPVAVRNKNLRLTGHVQTYKCFVYRLYTYFYDVPAQVYRPVQFEIKDKTYEAVLEEYGPGITSSQVYDERLMTYGRNSTDIKEKSNLEILIDEISSPFYVFQVFAIVFWAVWNDYFIYAMIILGISCLNVLVQFIKTKISLKKLYARAHYEIDLTVMRAKGAEGSGLVTRVLSSSTLVPGDLIEIPCNQKMPCDVVLLTGTCVMNESMLTGESIPVIKQHISKSDKIFDAKTADQYILYSGTECLETRRAHKDTPVMGFVLRTGFDTMKGRLVRSFLYSKPENFKFYRDSVKYIGAMSVVAVICFCVGIKTYIKDELEVGDYFVKLGEIITCAVPPALPTCLAVGTAMAAARLEKKKIVTKSELKINVAGRVKVMCFDKTGTLTRDSLDLFGVRPISNKESKAKFEPLISDNVHSTLNASSEKSTTQQMLELMATCHTLTYVRNVVSGDPLDLKMFEATQWKLKENDGTSGHETNMCTLHPPSGSTGHGYYNPDQAIEVIKRFEFVAKLQRMSAIVQDPRENKQRVYVKGSPEVLSTLCKPETLPEDFNKALLVYTQSGLRVIACATKLIQEKVTPHSQVERDAFENNLEFLGFLVFENKLKEITPSIINKLKDADVDTMMLTGDNPLTAIFVARDCGIVERHHRVILGSMVTSESDPKVKQIEWRYIEETLVNHSENANNQVAIDLVPENKQLVDAEPKRTGEIPQSQLEEVLEQDSKVAIALTGESTNYIVNANEVSDSLRKIIFKKSKVFARMRPDDKAYIVEKLQNQGNIVGMCGDGANDCPALKVANVGVALSEAEASLAAPFMSRITDISSVDIVLREGRCALVTSFQCFKFMSLYALIQTFNIAILNTRSSGMSNGTFLYEDLYVVLPLCLTMGMTAPTEKLSKKRPTENLLSATVLVGMFGQCIIQVVGQIIGCAILNYQRFYFTPGELNKGELGLLTAGMNEEDAEAFGEEWTTYDWDLTVVFLVAAFQFFATVMTFSIGKPFRKPFYTNWMFTFCLFYSTVTTLILILIPIEELFDLLSLRMFEGNNYFRWVILAVVLINGLLTVLYEAYVVPCLIKVAKMLKKSFKGNKKDKKDKKEKKNNEIKN